MSICQVHLKCIYQVVIVIEIWIMCINWIYFVCRYLFQAAEEETNNEIKPIGGADMKSGSEALRNKNDGQGNYDGMTISFTFFLLFLFGICSTQFSKYIWYIYNIYIYICVLNVCLIFPRRRNGIHFQRSWCQGGTFFSFIGKWSGSFGVLYC